MAAAAALTASIKPWPLTIHPSENAMVSDEEIAEIGRTIDLSFVVSKAKEKYQWADQHASEAMHLYLSGLYICRNYPKRCFAAISHSGDAIWHQHIIDTQKYADDCNILLWRFLSRQPIYGNPSGDDDRVYNDTVAEFGWTPADLGRTSGSYSYGVAAY